ncbi:MAG: alpha/beta fold hydrolase [Phycisphaerales bacterium]|nr:alpha/beta fold hydrolase [Phycisphaerales bacterium]
MTRRVISHLLALTLVLVLAPLSRAALAPDEHWKGEITLPGGVQLALIVHFHPSADQPGQWTATLDIPQQGLKDAPMADVTYTDTELAFTLKMAGAVFTAKIDETGQSAEGQLAQHGMTFPMHLQRQSAEEIARQLEAEKPNRPQTPQPPFPYEVREVTYRNQVDDITIAGTLTIPDGEGPFPAVVMITGSGPQDRDESLKQHQPFWIIADYLSRHGIAVLRSDDRGVGGTSGSVSDSTSEGFARDALAGVAYLKTVDRINHEHIGVMGHSEGGIVGPLAASQSDDVAFVVTLAGTGLPGSDILRLQTRLIAAASGMLTDKQLDEMEETQKEALACIMSDAPRQEKIDMVVALMREQGMAADDATLNALAEQQLAQMNSAWFKFFYTYDPRPALRKVTCPVLAINGSLDLQVPPKENLEEIRKALTEAGNKDFTIKELEGLNHLFQHATTGSPDEYGKIEETFAPEALELIANWINTRFGGTPDAGAAPATIQ